MQRQRSVHVLDSSSGMSLGRNSYHGQVQLTLFHLTTTTVEDARSSPTLILFAYNVKFIFLYLRRSLSWLFAIDLQENGTGMCGMLRRIMKYDQKFQIRCSGFLHALILLCNSDLQDCQTVGCSVSRPKEDVGGNFSSEEAIYLCVVKRFSNRRSYDFRPFHIRSADQGKR